MEYLGLASLLGCGVLGYCTYRLHCHLEMANEVLTIVTQALIAEGVIEEVTNGDIAEFDGEDWLEG